MAQRSVRVHAIGVGEHHAVAISHHVVEMWAGAASSRVDVIGRRRRKAVGDDDAVAIAGKAVARRAEDAETLRPRANSAAVTGGGVFSAAARATSPCATTLAGSGRAELPSGHSEVGA